MDLFRQNEPVLVNRDLLFRQPPIPEQRIPGLTPDSSLIQRRSSSSSNAETTGGSDSTPIIIGVVIPVLIIVIILFVIWRRRQTITKHEKANDKYRSLDFGIDEAAVRDRKNKKHLKGSRAPEMSIAEIKGGLRKDRGVSVDLENTSPYILPPELHSSRESLHSLSRSMHTGDDKYRATTFIPDDGSIRSPSSMRSHGDGSSIFSAVTRQRTGTMDTESKVELIPKTLPKRDASEAPSIRKPLPVVEKPPHSMLAPTPQESTRNSTVSTSSSNSGLPAAQPNSNSPAQIAHGIQQEEISSPNEKENSVATKAEVQTEQLENEPRPPPAVAVRNGSADARRPNARDNSHPVRNATREMNNSHHELPQRPHQPRERAKPQLKSSPPREEAAKRPPPAQKQPDQRSRGVHAQHASVPEINVEHQQDDYYDEYEEDVYDDGLGDYTAYIDYTYRGSVMGVRPLPPDDPTENPEQRANRIRSFYKEYFEDGENGQGDYQDWIYGYYNQPGGQGRHRAYSQGTYGHYSSGSGQRQRPKKKQLPPPKPLKVLPTPHMLKDDDFLPNAIDFAPPQIFKNQRSGTPDSARGGLRPYSPSVRPHVPLTSSFDDLAVIPSPHSLRKSGTFTALDFAPRRRFHGQGESISDAGSIRSNRSNLSKVHLANIRNGAYRVSRIPKDIAGTKDDMFTALRPQWDMRGNTSMPGR